MHVGGPAQLLKGLDPNKDQSYFLASVPAQALQRFTFPLGNMTKPDVRALAASAGLSSATRRSSAGVCFIGELPSAAWLLCLLSLTSHDLFCVCLSAWKQCCFIGELPSAVQLLCLLSLTRHDMTCYVCRCVCLGFGAVLLLCCVLKQHVQALQVDA